ncbi:MAG: carboxymuconolactone decarboxylase family protein [Steroidobacteraceae bacterium]
MSGKARAAAPATRTGNTIRDSALGLVPETVAEIVGLNDAVWQKSLVSATLLEVIRLRNARTVNCVYCKAVRYEVARADGLTEARATMIDADYQTSALSAREKLAIALADAYLGFPAGVTPQLAAALAREFSPEQIASLFVALMSFNFTSRTAVTIGGMPEDPPPVMLLRAVSTTT